MIEKNYNISELRELGEYPGINYEQKAHFSRFTGKTIVHRDYHRNYSFVSYALMFFIFSFIGWAWEVGIHIIEDGTFINRGTMLGPWLPIYGFGGICGILILKRFIDDHVKTFLLICALCAAVEYITSWYLDRFKHIRYWDYTGYFGNVNGRICFEGILIFGFAGCAGIYVMAPFFDDLLKKIPYKVCLYVSVILIVLFAADLGYSKFHPNTGKGITDYAVSISDKQFLKDTINKK